jgi:hypothetical protein
MAPLIAADGLFILPHLSGNPKGKMGQYYRQIAGIPMAFSVGLTMELLEFRFLGR